MNIRNETEHDPVSDLKVVDVYLRWALASAGQVVGIKEMAIGAGRAYGGQAGR